MPFDDAVECPLCMEMLDVDDVNFFPCTCGYQICRFCWHRIRTDENSLCPACRKQYQEDPAEFKPLTDDELTRIKRERRQKDVQRKQKAAESRRHLANIRVVQKNLVFAVGLSNRLADVEVLKRQEYFGKFGKIVKVVINSSTSYAGAQGPSASAYVTYTRPEDCLRAIQAVNNLYVDGRTLKASLGTTKYCSHFLKGTQCTKPDCMYLHELGDEVASFTKEDMQLGKHQEYEQRLVEQYLQPATPTSCNQLVPTESCSLSPGATGDVTTTTNTSLSTPSDTVNHSTTTHSVQQLTTERKLVDRGGTVGLGMSSNEPWPVLSSLTNKQNNQSGNLSPVPATSLQPSAADNGTGNGSTEHESDLTQSQNHSKQLQNTMSSPFHNATGRHNLASHNGFNHSPQSTASGPQTPTLENESPRLPNSFPRTDTTVLPSAARKLPFTEDLASGSTSLFSGNSGFGSFTNMTGFHTQHNPVTTRQTAQSQRPLLGDHPSVDLLRNNDSSICSSAAADWQSGLSSFTLPADDDLGFDPFLESNKALADLMESETNSLANMSLGSNAAPLASGMLGRGIPDNSSSLNGFSGINMSRVPLASAPTPPPPGLSGYFSGIGQPQTAEPFRGSRMMGLMNLGSSQQNNSGLPTGLHPSSLPGKNGYLDMNHGSMHNKLIMGHTGKGDADALHNTHDMREGLKALLPNVPINFAPSSPVQAPHGSRLRNGYTNNTMSSWNGMPGQGKPTHADDQFMDPAIITGCLSGIEGSPPASQPHWMKSIQQLTETESPVKQQSQHMQLPYGQRGMSAGTTVTHSRMPFAQNMPLSGNTSNGWPGLQSHNPPPGFQASFRNSTQNNTHMATTLES